MRETRETLWKDYKKVSEKIDEMEVTSEQYQMLLDERDKIRNELIKLEQVTMENEVKKIQIEAEDKRDNIRNNITIGTFAITTGVSIWTVIKTFKFDQTATVTSTLGRNTLTNVVTKMFKK